MSKSSFKIDVTEIVHHLKKSNPEFKKKDLEKVTGVSNNTIASWEKEAPDVIELLYLLSKDFDMNFTDMVKSSSDAFASIKLLKYFNFQTSIDLESVIIKPE